MSESRLDGVEIFQAGTHRDKAYTGRDLDAMVDNFNRASTGKRPRLRVPAVLGHDEDQVTLRGSGLPAAAWCERVYRDGDKLKADFAGVPPQVMRLLRNKVYRTVSAEIYDEPPKGVPGKGKMLRRVAFLGGDIPQVKSLDDIPVPEAMAERFDPPPRTVLKSTHYRKLPGGAYACFSEVTPVQDAATQPMDPERMTAALQDMGADASLFQGVPPAALAEVLRLCGDLKARADKPAADMGDGMDADDAPLPDPKDDDEKAMFAERAKRMAGRARKFWEKYLPGKKFGEDGDDTGTDTGVIEDELVKKKADDDKGMEKMSESAVAALVEKAVERALAGQVRGSIDRLTRFAEEQEASRKKLAIDAFCEAQLREGKVLPRELDPRNPASLKARLYRADARATVAKLAENGRQVEKTELDLQMDEIRGRPAFKFGESVRGGAELPGEAEVERVERFSESPPMARALEANGQKPADFVKAFKKAREANPSLTAAAYGVPDTF